MTVINYAIAATIAAAAARRRREQQPQIPAPIHPNPRTMTATTISSTAPARVESGIPQETCPSKPTHQLVSITSASYGCYNGTSLRAALRPKPPSLKEMALEALEAMNEPLGVVTVSRVSIIRRALEALDD
jgi:hypothetical protein